MNNLINYIEICPTSPSLKSKMKIYDRSSSENLDEEFIALTDQDLEIEVCWNIFMMNCFFLDEFKDRNGHIYQSLILFIS